jgi:hypothetical protein
VSDRDACEDCGSWLGDDCHSKLLASLRDAETMKAALKKERAKLFAIHDALHCECDGTADLPAEIRALRERAERAEEERDAALGQVTAMVEDGQCDRVASKLADQLCEVLGREVGKTGESEGAVQVAERIILERDAERAKVSALVEAGERLLPYTHYSTSDFRGFYEARDAFEAALAAAKGEK